MPKDLESEEEFVQLARACNFLEHYHLEHTDDLVTRFRGKSGRPDIYVVGDEEWKRKMAALVTPIFPPSPPRKVGRRLHRRYI